MSDFDAVLERLLADPSFAASLAADPAATLAGYRLGADEMELLSAQLSPDAGGQSGVEARTSQASMFGLLTPLAGAIGIGGAVSGSGQSGFGPADHSGFGPAEQSGFGPAGQSGFGPADHSGFGPADAAGPAGDQGTLGGLIDGDLADAIGERITGADQAAPESSAMPPMPAAPTAPPDGYHTRVDVDGDGDWDKHWYVRRDDGGVDIMADMNRDGRADFVGHDYDRDGLVDAADYDKNRDGVFETHMFDDDGDGWLDRKIISPGQ